MADRISDIVSRATKRPRVQPQTMSVPEFLRTREGGPLFNILLHNLKLIHGALQGGPGVPEIEARLGLVMNRGFGDERRLFDQKPLDPADPTSLPVDVAFFKQQHPSVPNVETAFVPGVSAAIMRSVERALGRKDRTVTHELDVIHTEDDLSQSRGSRAPGFDAAERQRTTFTIREDGGGECKGRLQKIKPPNASFDIAIRSARSDLRLGAAGEVPLAPPTDAEAADLFRRARLGQLKSREKRRVSLRPERRGGRGRSAWRVDVTRTLDGSHAALLEGAGAASAAMEVELELSEDAARAFLALSAPEAVEGEARRLAAQLCDAVGALNPSESAGLEELPAAGAAAAEAAAAAVREAVSRSASHHPGAADGGVPGAMPVNMARRDLSSLQELVALDVDGADEDSAPVLCAEKTDGVRYLLVGAGGCATLVDRKMRCFACPGGAEAVGACLPDGAVVDGELVLLRDCLEDGRLLSRVAFLAFDLLCAGRGEPSPAMDALLSERLRRLRALEAQVKERLRPLQSAAGGEAVVVFRAKRFVRLRGLPSLLGALRAEPRGTALALLSQCSVPRPVEILTRAPEERTRHRTDGVIFAPNAPYRPGTDPRLLKWKFPDSITIDLRVVREGPRLELFTFGEDGADDLIRVTALIKLHATDEARLRADLALCRAADVAVAELAHDVDTGEWVYCSLRPDKDRPNFVGTVLATLQEIGGGIGVAELQFRLSGGPGADDWQYHVSRMEDQILQHGLKQGRARRA